MIENISFRGTCGVYRSGHIPDFSGVNQDYLLRFPGQGLEMHLLSPLSQAPVLASLFLTETSEGLHTEMAMDIPLVAAVEAHNVFHTGVDGLSVEIECAKALARVLLFKLGFKCEEIDRFVESLLVTEVVLAWHTEPTMLARESLPVAPVTRVWTDGVRRPKWVTDKVGPYPSQVFNRLSQVSRDWLTEFTGWIGSHPRLEIAADANSLRSAGINRLGQLNAAGVSRLRASVEGTLQQSDLEKIGVGLNDFDGAALPADLAAASMHAKESAHEQILLGHEFLYSGVVPKQVRGRKASWAKDWKGFVNYPPVFGIPMRPLSVG